MYYLDKVDAEAGDDVPEDGEKFSRLRVSLQTRKWMRFQKSLNWAIKSLT